MRRLLLLLVPVGIAIGGAYLAAGTRPGPTITIVSPRGAIGASTPLDVSIDAAGAGVAGVHVSIEQNGATASVLGPENANLAQHLSTAADGGVRVTHLVGKESVPSLVPGPARLIVSASRPVFFGLRHVTSTASRDVVVRLEPPRLNVFSTHHYVNQGGAELVVYQVSPADAVSGVRVGDVEYPGYPAAGLMADRVAIADPSSRVAFFALGHDQGAATPISLFAVDEAGNRATAPLDARIFPKAARESRIDLPDALLQRVVPAILASTDEVRPGGSLIRAVSRRQR